MQGDGKFYASSVALLYLQATNIEQILQNEKFYCKSGYLCHVSIPALPEAAAAAGFWLKISIGWWSENFFLLIWNQI